ncbi:THUMP domain-containing protein 1 homolog isoform X2 [Cimex lectularius]|uniref:THUMP domain-containing protein n=1 Tax=Cimex lectularius TaxID=79782 RepID=A0A8I6SJV6_CIMLE|nr:THUMP domain-containing protein 1 homolog isoform X2 [Cimex lectularius]
MSPTGKKRKGYYMGSKAKKAKRDLFGPGMKGFLCTCNKRVKECIREAYNVLDDFASKLYPKLEDPTKLAEAIAKDIHDTKIPRSKCLIRLIPINTTCKAYMDDITKMADKMFDEYFKGDPTTFSIFYTKRNNNTLLRDEVISMLVQLVRDRNPGHKVDLKNSKKTIVIEVLKAVCGISVVSNFHQYRRYNLLELCKKDGKEGENKPISDD